MSEAGERASMPGGAEEMNRPGITEADADSFRVIDEYVEHAREYHAQHGVWPPDALLDEVDDMRRQIMAEHGNDWRKVLDHYGELGKKNPNRVVHAQRPAGEEPSAA